MEKLGESLAAMPNDMVISGHTDAVPFTRTRNYDNWDLSSDRANEMRRVLLKSGVPQERITRVSGMADTELLVPEDPRDPSNRRITVLLEYRKPAGGIGNAPAPEAPGAEVGASAGDAIRPKQPAPAPRKAEAAPAAPADPPERVSRLDDKVFEDLRSALR